MKNYSSKYYQEQIVSEYNINDIKFYTNRLAAIQNRALTGFKSNCILSGMDCYIINKTINNLNVYITPGRFLANDIYNELQSPIILDTKHNITSNTKSIFITAFNIDNQYKFKLATFLVDDTHIYNPEGLVWNDSFLILCAFQLIFDNNYYRIYSYIFHNDYKKLILGLNIPEPLQLQNLAGIGYSPACDCNSKMVLFDNEYYIRPIIPLNDIISNNLIQYNHDTSITKNSIPKVVLPDLELYLSEYERCSRVNSIFSEFYNDFYC